MRYLPPRGRGAPEGGLTPDFDDSLSVVEREAINDGEMALREVRARTVDSWIAAGAAWEVLQRAAMYRSNSNAPAGRRYNVAYAILGHPWPELAKIDKKSRMDAIWLFKNSDEIRFWLASFPQNKRDPWTHPSVIRRNYERQRPAPKDKPAEPYKLRPRQSRKPPANPLSRADLTREELEAHIDDLEHGISDRDRTIIDLNEQIAAQRSRIAELESDKAWLQAEVRQLQGIVTPPVAAEEAHASREVVPPVRFGKPHYPGWARQMSAAITAATSVVELQWLRDDNRTHIDAFEAETPGAGKGVEQRIDQRILELQSRQ
jgi:uncharacterized coiled-coil protein SlyX